MRLALLFFVAALLVGCRSSHVSYGSGVSITPADEPGQYAVQFMIRQNTRSPGAGVLSAPRLIVKVGEKGEVTVDDERGGATCTAVVTDVEGKVTAATSVTVRKGGREVWSGQQTISLKR